MSDLEIRINARLQATKQLEDQPVSIQDRGVALFGPHDRRCQCLERRLQDLLQGGRRTGDDFTEPSLAMAALFDHFQQVVAEAHFGRRIQQEPFFRFLNGI